jgi:hypothetical protein
MEKIEPLPDQSKILRFREGEQVEFEGQIYTVLSRTTLASGEPALVLGREGEQFFIGAARFFAGNKKKA